MVRLIKLAKMAGAERNSSGVPGMLYSLTGTL